MYLTSDSVDNIVGGQVKDQEGVGDNFFEYCDTFLIPINRTQDLYKQEFKQENKSNSKNWITLNCPKNTIYKEVKLHHLTIIPNKGNANNKFNEIGIDKIGDYINIYDEDLVIKTN